MMLTHGDVLHTLAMFAGVHTINFGGAYTCDRLNGGTMCGRDAVVVDPESGDFLCVGHLKLAAAVTLEMEAWDVNGVRA